MVALVLTFAYTFLATGVDQVLFKHQADGSITPNGSTAIGQNWSITKCPGHPLGSCVFQGRPDALGPYASTKFNPNLHPGDDPLYSNGLTQSTTVACSFPRRLQSRSTTSPANRVGRASAHGPKSC